jgi:hypothetical protein
LKKECRKRREKLIWRKRSRETKIKRGHKKRRRRRLGMERKVKSQKKMKILAF